MARPLRIQFPGGTYHVLSRGIERRPIFLDTPDKQKFLEYLRRTKRKFALKIFAYVLMDNHYHLLLETPLGNLAHAMQYLNTCYTTYFNGRMNRAGHLFQGRYKSLLVDKDRYLLELTRYIHLNPVRAGAAHGITSLRQFKYSSHLDYVDYERKTDNRRTHQNGLVDSQEILEQFSQDIQRARSLYEAFVAEGVQNHRAAYKPLHDTVAASCILGSRLFVEKVKRKFHESRKHFPLDTLCKKELQSGFAAQEILDTVFAYYGIPGADALLGRIKNQYAPAKKIAIMLMRKHTALTAAEIGAMFRVTFSAVSHAARKVEQDEKLYFEAAQVESALKAFKGGYELKESDVNSQFKG